MLAARLSAALLAIAASSAWGWKLDPQLLAMLPPYCPYTQLYRDQVGLANVEEGVRRWTAILGPANFPHLHHYCWGLEHMARALREPGGRHWYHQVAVGEFDYVLQQVTPDFALLPEVLLKKGQSLIGMGRGPEAIPEFMRAIGFKPDYWPPYAELSDFYKSVGNTEEATRWLVDGLAAAPGTRPLEQRLQALQAERKKPEGAHNRSSKR